MASAPSKRRKIERDDGSRALPTTTYEGLERLEHEGESELKDSSAKGAPPSQKTRSQSRQTRSHEDDGGAIYAGDSYKSSMFKLQVDELLAETRPNYEKRLGGVDDALRRLKGLIESIGGKEALSITDAIESLYKSHKITAPFPDPKPDKDAAYKLAYAKPSNINVVGSYALKTMVKADLPSVDMIVVMPTSIFQEKDYINYRYFYKRAYYLAWIAGALQNNLHDEISLNFEYLNGNSLHPILVAKPNSTGRTKDIATYEIRIIPAAPPSFFAEPKLRPNKNSVRPKDSNDKDALPPTPFYNASIRSDCNFESYLKILHSVSKQAEGFKNACVLGRTWLRQRGFRSSLSGGGFGHFEWAALTALLLKGGGPKGHSILSPGYSSYQLFKAVVQFLATHDLVNKPFAFETAGFAPAKSGFPTFYDGPRGQDLLYKMTPWSYQLLREEAKLSIDMLNDSTFDQFESAFILRPSQPLHRYDCVIRIPFSRKLPQAISCDHVSQTTKVASRMVEVLKQGLTDRVKLVSIDLPESVPWTVKSAGPPSATEATEALSVFMVFDPANVDRLVDHGPSAEEKKKAEQFQKFWGEKAELRRFRDGSILESLVWSPGSTYAIVQEIVRYLVNRHFSSELSTGLTFIGEGFDTSLPGHVGISKTFNSLNEAFSTFEKDIRGLEGLPLELRQLSAISPQLRYSSVDPPTFSQHQPLKVPAGVLIQFEGSGRWPDDIVAIQRTKIAFLLRIGTLLEESKDGITARLGLENEDLAFQNCAFLDVVYPSGAAFRLRIHNEREQTLLERLVKEKSTDNRTREEAVSSLSAFNRSFLQLPVHTQSISTHCTRFPLLSPTIRLVKLWLDKHMLSAHISPELIELLVARTFLQPYPWRAPSSVMTGFLRTLLFISRWNWRLAPLIVDFNGTLTSKDVSSINTRLEAWRKIDPAMNRTVLLAASNHDATGTAFTDRGPNKMIAARMTALARSACKLVREKGVDLDHRSLFASSTTDYDFLIHISPNFNDRKAKHSSHKFKNLAVQSETYIERVGYNPVQLFLQELEKVYEHSIVFFHSESVGSCIAGLWNPQMAAKRGFKVNLAYATKPSGPEGEIMLDKEAILSEIARLGGDLVERVEAQR